MKYVVAAERTKAYPCIHLAANRVVQGHACSRVSNWIQRTFDKYKYKISHVNRALHQATVDHFGRVAAAVYMHCSFRLA